jgi:hypothetical protein
MTDSENLPPRRSTRLRSETQQYPKPSVSPLRISKSTSKSKSLAAMAEDTTLRDISPGSSRRNSPSTFQIKEKVAALQTAVTKEVPPSPPLGMVKSESASSVRTFWQNAAKLDEQKNTPSKTEDKDLKRSSFVKNNVFLAKDLKERENSPLLTMSPSQQRLSSQIGESATSPTKILAPSDTPSPRKETRPGSTAPSVDATPKPSCLHSNRIKGPRSNLSDDSDDTTPVLNRRERRKTVTFDQAPQILEFDRRSSHSTTSGDSDHSSAIYDGPDELKSRRQSVGVADPFDDSEQRPLPTIPRPLPQVPSHDSEDDRPSSKDSHDSQDYGAMEDRIRSMMERVVLRKNSIEPKREDTSDQEDIFSLYTTTNEMSDDESPSQDSGGFSSQGTTSTAPTSQGNSQDDELERQLALAEQSEELLKAVQSRPFSLAELPDLGFGNDSQDDLGLGEYCSPAPFQQAPERPIAAKVANPVVEEPVKEEPRHEFITPPVTPPLGSDPDPPETPQDQILPPPDTATPPTSPHKNLEEDDPPSPAVPEQEATIRSRGGSKLRIRPSLSRQEAESIVARRRKSEIPPLPPLYNIREGSVEPDVKVKIEEDDLSEFGGKISRKVDVGPLLRLESLGFEMDREGSGFGEMAVEEMERVIEAQKVYSRGAGG